MRVIAHPSELARIRSAVRRHLPQVRASHLAEATARGLGFGTNAASLAWERERLRGDLPLLELDPDAMRARLGELGSTVSRDELGNALAASGGLVTGPGYDRAIQAGIDAGADLPDGKAARAGYVGFLMNWRVTVSFGMRDFLVNYADPSERDLHLRLAAAVDTSSTLDPDIAAFLVDSLLVVHRARAEGIRYPDWRDAAHRAYAPRVRAFLDSMSWRGPLGRDPFEGPVPVTPARPRPRVDGHPTVTTSTSRDELPGPFDAGRAEPDPDTMTGVALMAMWRLGRSDDEIQARHRELAEDLVGGLERFHGVRRESMGAMEAFMGDPLDEVVWPKGDGRPDVVVLDDDEAARVVAKAGKIGWRVAEVEADDGAPRAIMVAVRSDPHILWLRAEDQTVDAETLGMVVRSAMSGHVVLVTGMAPDDVERLDGLCRDAEVTLATTPGGVPHEITKGG